MYDVPGHKMQTRRGNDCGTGCTSLFRIGTHIQAFDTLFSRVDVNSQFLSNIFIGRLCSSILTICQKKKKERKNHLFQKKKNTKQNKTKERRTPMLFQGRHE